MPKPNLRLGKSAARLFVFTVAGFTAPALLAGHPLDGVVRKQVPSEALPGELPLLAAAAPSAAPEVKAPSPSPTSPAPVTAAEPPSLVPSDSPSHNVTINLIRRMVKRGLLTQEDADDLIHQAEEDAAIARERDAAMHNAIAQVQAQAAANFAPDPALLAAGDDSVRVTYIPETVKAEMRDQIRQDVMDQAREEHWATPKLVPDWAMRIRLFGDIRVRGEYDGFPNGNDNTGAFPNFNAINTGNPFDVSGTVFSPQLNVDRDRQRLRLRARVGLEADLGQGFSAGMRIATGENNSPTSTNQSFGLANQAQGGNFSKYAIWLDRGYLKYETGPEPDRHLALTLGRFENPFFGTEAVWDDDVGFDGVAVLGRYKIVKGVTPFITAGAFPVFNTDFNFSSNQPSKFKSSDKWLYAIQGGVDWKIKRDWNVKLGAAYYHFDNVEGQLSDPFVPLNASDQGNTDDTRPSFAQKGNTYFPLRRIIPTAANNFGTTNQFQYFGLATPFHELALTGRVDYTRWEPYKLSLTGEYIRNLAFDRGSIGAVAVNNRGPDSPTGALGSFDGGDTAWYADLKFGSATMDKRWDWAIGANYRYIESDAVVDAFNDSDFGGGGTNLQGYGIYGILALSPRISVGARWLSAREIAGPPFREDVFQIDFNGKF